ncbi:hypothetical protein C2U71_30920 [Burkholderia ubonensis]|nr:hypothetical protein C2U71_30920 [Burkholderia ubonensis]
MRATRAASTSTPTSAPAAKPRYRRRGPSLLMGASSAGHQQKRLPPANGLAGVSLRAPAARVRGPMLTCRAGCAACGAAARPRPTAAGRRP